MDEQPTQSRPPPRRVALLLFVTALLVGVGLAAVMRGDQALLDHVGSR